MIFFLRVTLRNFKAFYFFPSFFSSNIFDWIYGIFFFPLQISLSLSLSSRFGAFDVSSKASLEAFHTQECAAVPRFDATLKLHPQRHSTLNSVLLSNCKLEAFHTLECATVLQLDATLKLHIGGIPQSRMPRFDATLNSHPEGFPHSRMNHCAEIQCHFQDCGTILLPRRD